MKAALGLAALLLALPADPPKRKPNRLAAEKSPYLLQHAHNPVDWFPWGEEALKKARAEDRPIFLSIGYSTCHWCHVMERESFENEEIARVLNEHFVAVKVDREERPDVDEVYMQAVQALTGHGGWPLSVFLTPEGKPFFGGTYFPPEDDPGRGRGFKGLLLLVAKTWKEDRGKLVENSDRLVSHLRGEIEGAGAKGATLTPALLAAGLETFRRLHDLEHGGFGRAPKFPRTSTLDFLLAMSLRPGTGEAHASARSMALSTLDHMAAGGISDHLAGGFHRYSTDREWTVPHFEKMLYDQALIARAYLDAGRLTRDERHTAAARGILDYVQARLAHPEGGFLSAEDADSEGVEGKCYVWTRDEVQKLLGEEEGKLLCDFHGVSAEGNFEGTPQNVLTARLGLEEMAKRAGLKPEDLRGRLEAGRRKLLAARDQRIQPRRDDKVLADWNGLMISAFAVAHQATEEARYLQAAERAADFIHQRMVRAGRLLHRFRDGEAAIPGFLEDHAFLCLGLLDLYEAGFDLARLREALRLAREMVRLFWDERGGAFFQTGPDHETLILRRKEFYDGAIPSGNSVAYQALQRLVELTADGDLQAKVKALDQAAATVLADSPAEHPALLAAAAFRLSPPRQIAVVGGKDDPAAREMARAVQRRYLPHKVLVRVGPETLAPARELMPFLEAKTALDGKATAYVCRGGTCKLPARDLAALEKQLAE